MASLFKQLFSPKGWGFLFSRHLSLGHRPEGQGVPRRQWAPLLGYLMGGSPVSSGGSAFPLFVIVEKCCDELFRFKISSSLKCCFPVSWNIVMMLWPGYVNIRCVL